MRGYLGARLHAVLLSHGLVGEMQQARVSLAFPVGPSQREFYQAIGGPVPSSELDATLVVVIVIVGVLAAALWYWMMRRAGATRRSRHRSMSP